MAFSLPKVLVVSGDEATRMGMLNALERDGYPSDFAVNGEDALERLYKDEFDVVFVDTLSDGMTGLELAEAVRKDHVNAEVVLVGAHPTIDTTSHAFRLGVYDFLVKPIDNPQIISTLMRRLNDKVRLNRQNQLLLRDLQSNNTALVRLNQTIKMLYDDIVGLYIDTQRRNATLDMDTIYARGLSALRDFLGARDVVLFRYDAIRQVLSGERAVQAEIAEARAVSLVIPEKEFAAIQENVSLAALLDGVFSTRTPLVVPIFQGQTPWGAIAVLERESGPFTIFERNLLRQFVDWLALSFEGAHLYKAIFDLSTVDGLTGLFNHRYFQERLKSEVARAARYKHAVSLLFCDIDNFKVYNDTKGHVEGDRLLREIARSLRNTSRLGDMLIAFRECDVAARYGGEEFVVILPETSVDGAIVKAERLRRAIEATPFRFREVLPGGRVTLSIGVAEFPRHARTREELITAADRAVYRAKQNGRNRVATPEGSDGATATPSA